MASVQFSFERDAYNYEIVDQVKRIIDFFAALGKDFTAYDITQQVRIYLGSKIKVDHEDVRKAVHIAMSGRPKYTQDSHPKGAILYKYSPSNKITLTQQLPLKPGPKLVPPPATMQFPKSIANALKNMNHAFAQLQPVLGKTPKGVRKPDRRGSLTIPKKLIDNVGSVNKWGIVPSNSDANMTILAPVTHSSKIKYKTTYTKDKSGNIRVTKKHLPKTTIGQYKVEWTNQGNVLIQGV